MHAEEAGQQHAGREPRDREMRDRARSTASLLIDHDAWIGDQLLEGRQQGGTFLPRISPVAPRLTPAEPRPWRLGTGAIGIDDGT